MRGVRALLRHGYRTRNVLGSWKGEGSFIRQSPFRSFYSTDLPKAPPPSLRGHSIQDSLQALCISSSSEELKNKLLSLRDEKKYLTSLSNIEIVSKLCSEGLIDTTLTLNIFELLGELDDGVATLVKSSYDNLKNINAVRSLCTVFKVFRAEDSPPRFDRLVDLCSLNGNIAGIVCILEETCAEKVDFAVLIPSIIPLLMAGESSLLSIYVVKYLQTLAADNMNRKELSLLLAALVKGSLRSAYFTSSPLADQSSLDLRASLSRISEELYATTTRLSLDVSELQDEALRRFLDTRDAEKDVYSPKDFASFPYFVSPQSHRTHCNIIDLPAPLLFHRDLFPAAFEAQRTVIDAWLEQSAFEVTLTSHEDAADSKRALQMDSHLRGDDYGFVAHAHLVGHLEEAALNEEEEEDGDYDEEVYETAIINVLNA